MNNHHLQLAGAAGPRVDGIDVAELLRGLGEASATSSAIDLFGLCLSAQRVLVQLHAVAAADQAVGIANATPAGKHFVTKHENQAGELLLSNHASSCRACWS